jgi:hypothetical protein
VPYLRGVLSGVAAIFVALLGPGLLGAFRAIGQQKATGVGALYGALLESLLSPRFWILAILFFCLFFAASRLSSTALRIFLFWIPTVVFLTLGFSYVGLLTYLWIHFQRG